MTREPCCICGKPIVIGETFQLTEEEMAAIGPGATPELSYCSGCLKAMRNLQQGASVLAGYFERRLRAAGVPDAAAEAVKFKVRLLEAATRKLQ